MVVMQLQLSWDRGAFGGGVGFRVWYRSSGEEWVCAGEVELVGVFDVLVMSQVVLLTASRWTEELEREIWSSTGDGQAAI